MPPATIARRGLVLLYLLAPWALGQDLRIALGPDLYLPSVAEYSECEAEGALGFGFPDHHVDIMRSPMFFGQQEGRFESGCYLFRGVHGPEARRIVAETLRMFADAGFAHGIPSAVLGMFLVQNPENPHLIAFSFANEEVVLGPNAGVAGFDLDHEAGLLMYFWAHTLQF